MALKINVKVGEVSKLSDARYCAGMGVEMIGFPLDENHPKFIEISRVKEISSWISGIKVVGEFRGDNLKNVNYLSEQLALEYIQLEFPVALEEVKLLNKPLILKVDLKVTSEPDAEKIFEEFKDVAAYFLLENEESESFPASIQNWCQIYPIILGFGVTPTNLEIILNEIRPVAIGLKGGDEIKAGLKNFDQLADILENLEED